MFWLNQGRRRRRRLVVVSECLLSRQVAGMDDTTKAAAAAVASAPPQADASKKDKIEKGEDTVVEAPTNPEVSRLKMVAHM